MNQKPDKLGSHCRHIPKCVADEMPPLPASSHFVNTNSMRGLGRSAAVPAAARRTSVGSRFQQRASVLLSAAAGTAALRGVTDKMRCPVGASQALFVVDKSLAIK